MARTRRLVQAGLTLWLGWLVVTALTFSLMAGIFHAYYTVALAPAIGALVGIGAWRALAAPGVAASPPGVLAFTIAVDHGARLRAARPRDDYLTLAEVRRRHRRASPPR